jgi:hypothetical protein
MLNFKGAGLLKLGHSPTATSTKEQGLIKDAGRLRWGNLLAVGGAFLGGWQARFGSRGMNQCAKRVSALSRGVPPHDVQDARRGRRP